MLLLLVQLQGCAQPWVWLHNPAHVLIQGFLWEDRRGPFSLCFLSLFVVTHPIPAGRRLLVLFPVPSSVPTSQLPDLNSCTESCSSN